MGGGSEGHDNGIYRIYRMRGLLPSILLILSSCRPVVLPYLHNTSASTTAAGTTFCQKIFLAIRQALCSR